MTVSLKSSSVLKDLQSLMPRGQNKFDGPTIIYCPTKKLTSEIVQILRGAGIKCDRYHGALDMKERKTIQKSFLADKIEVMVATVGLYYDFF
jgi:werner syndrome ATP-dependent helicase